MKSREEIQENIAYLENLKREWTHTRLDKSEAQSLSTKIYMFYHSIESRYSDFFDEEYPHST